MSGESMTQLNSGETTKYKIQPNDYVFRSTITGWVVIRNNQTGKEESFKVETLRAMIGDSAYPQYMRDLALKALQETENL